MSEKSNLPTRVCSACGIPKPLSAFLQISGLKGSGYGNICSTCRGKGIDPFAKKTDKDEHSSTTSTVAIDADVRIKNEMDRLKYLKDKKDADRKEVKRRDFFLTEKKEQKISKEKIESNRREYQKTPPRNFLGDRQKSGTTTTEQSARESLLLETQRIVESQTIDASVKEEVKKTMLDLMGPFVASQFGEVGKHYGDAIRRLKTLLGESAPFFTKALDLYVQQKNSAAQKDVTAPETDPAIDFARKNFGSKR